MRLTVAGSVAPPQQKLQPAPPPPQYPPPPQQQQQQQQQQQHRSVPAGLGGGTTAAQQAAAAAAALGLPRLHRQAPLDNGLPPASGKERVRAMNLEPVLWRLAGGPDGVTASEVTLPEPVPLAVMVDLLSDLWEAEGLTDQ
jgi:hypothetical protein